MQRLFATVDLTMVAPFVAVAALVFGAVSVEVRRRLG
jgi:hypothetical protein